MNNGNGMNFNDNNYLDWIICGCNGDIFVGKLVTGNANPGEEIYLNPCYKYSTFNVQVPQVDGLGRTVGMNIAVQESVTSPANCPGDVGVKMKVDWATVNNEHSLKTIERLVKVARDQQMAIRSAAAGISTAGRIKL